MNLNKKILILYAAIGLGHKTIAENIAYHLKNAGYEIQLMDVQKTQGGFLAEQGKKLYQWIIPRLPFIWDWLYNSTWFTNMTLGFRTKVAAKNYNLILNEILLFQPDMVICAHTTASAILSYLKKEGLYKGLFVPAFSDFHLHRYWLYNEADAYLANTPEQKEEMIDLGVYRNKIFVCGITLKPKQKVDVEKTKIKYGIYEGDKVVLISSGSQGFGIGDGLIAELIKRENIKVIVVCGSNQKIFSTLEEKFKGTNATILTYHDFMDELYAVADIFVTKAGALSVSEALKWRVPILVSHLLPGQEIHNYSYLLEKGLIMPEPINITESVLEELETGAFKKSILENQEIDALCTEGKEVSEAVSQAMTFNMLHEEERV